MKKLIISNLDGLLPGAKDYPAQEAGVVSIQVRDPGETQWVVETVTACREIPTVSGEAGHA